MNENKSNRKRSKAFRSSVKTLVSLVFACVFFCHGILSSGEPTAVDEVEPRVFLHVFGSHQGSDYDPEDPRPESERQREHWSSVVTTEIHLRKSFFLRCPNRRSPLISIAGVCSREDDGSLSGRLDYEFDDSNLSFTGNLDRNFQLDRPVLLMEHYWVLVFSHEQDAYACVEALGE